MRSIRPARDALIALGLVPVVIASVALATVAGFVVAVLPGGLGVREGVLMSALAPAIGSDQAVIASLVLRLVWVAAELVAAAILFPWFRHPPSDGNHSPANEPGLPMISVVVPVHDEEESLATLHGELDAVFADGARGPVEFIFVDDGSRDGSWAVLAALAERDPRVRAIRFRRNFGKAAALTAGFQAAGATWSSRSTATSRTTRPRFRAFWPSSSKGYDVVSGWKKTRHDPWHKVYPSRVFNWMVSRVTGCRLHDHNCGFKLYRSEVLREIGIYGELHRFIPVLAHARGFRVAEVEVRHRTGATARPSMGSRGFSRGFSTC